MHRDNLWIELERSRVATSSSLLDLNKERGMQRDKERQRQLVTERSRVATSSSLLDLHKVIYMRREFHVDRTREEQSGHFLMTTRPKQRNIHE